MKLLSKTTVSKMLDISVRKLERVIAAGEIKIVKIGRLTKIKLSEVHAYIERNTHGGLAQ